MFSVRCQSDGTQRRFSDWFDLDPTVRIQAAPQNGIQFGFTAT